MTKKSLLSVASALALLSAFSGSSLAQVSEIHTVPQGSGVLTNVAFANLQAGQFNVGMQAVKLYTLPQWEKIFTNGTTKRGTWYPPGPQGLLAYERDYPAPVILGPDQTEHLLDNHHRTYALYLLSTIFTNSTTVTYTDPNSNTFTTNIGPAPSTVWVEQIGDGSSKSMEHFWKSMQLGNTRGQTNFEPTLTSFLTTTNQPSYVWNYNDGVLVRDLVKTPPPFIPGLTDDTLRSVAGSISRYEVNTNYTPTLVQGVGYVERGDNDVVLDYQEFYWANFLRSKIYWATSTSTLGQDPNATYKFTNYDEMCAFAANQLCHEKDARDLPGFIPFPSINFPAPLPLFQRYIPNGTFPLVATTTSDGAFTFTSSDSNVITIGSYTNGGNTNYFGILVGTGNVTITAGVAAATNSTNGGLTLFASNSATRSTTITKATQKITCSAPPTLAFFRGATFAIDASAPGGPIAFRSSNRNVLTVDTNGVLTVQGRGKSEITLTQNGGSNFYNATVRFIVTVR